MPPRSHPAESAALDASAERAFVETIREGVRSYAEGEAIDFRFGEQGFAIGLPDDPTDGSFRAEVRLAEGFFTEKGFDAAMATAAINHEVEHLREWLTLVRTPAGARLWREHVRALKEDGRLHVLDNMVDDVRMNRTVLQRSGAHADALERLYRHYAFPEADLRRLPSGEANPRHLQFAQSLLRDAMLPGEAASIAPDVASARERVLAAVNADRSARGLAAHPNFQAVVAQITDPKASPEARLGATRRYLEPVYRALYDRDVEEAMAQRGDASGQGGEPAGGSDATGAQRPDAAPTLGANGDEAPPGAAGVSSFAAKRPLDPTDAAKESTRRSIFDAVRDLLQGKGSRTRTGYSAPEQVVSGPAAASDPAASASPVDLTKLAPEEVFPEAYAEQRRHRPTLLEDSDWQKLAEALANKVAAGKQPTSPEALADRRQFFAESAPEAPTEQDWAAFQAWKRLRAHAEAVTDADGKRIVDELREIFANILSHRRRKNPSPRAPQEEGDALSAEHLVDAWLALRHGDDTAEIWQVERTKETPAERVGCFDVTVVADLSGSMLHGGKDAAQREAIVLVLAALEDFRRDIAYEQGSLRDELAVRSEAWAFGNGPILLKPLSERLTPMDCARVVSGLSPNREYITDDYAVLAQIRQGIDADPPYKEKLLPQGGRRAPEVRRVVLVFTDGKSNNTPRCQQELAELRTYGVKVAAIGITALGDAVTTTYAPDGQVCPDARELARAAGILLRAILKTPDLGYTEENP